MTEVILEQLGKLKAKKELPLFHCLTILEQADKWLGTSPEQYENVCETIATMITNFHQAIEAEDREIVNAMKNPAREAKKSDAEMVFGTPEEGRPSFLKLGRHRGSR